MISDANRFLAKYYAYNLIYSKIGGRLAATRLSSRVGDWNELRSRVAGNSTWLVVGNGPSLKAEDLTALKAIPSIASNKISLLYANTPWRPTLYTIADPLLLFKLPRPHFDAIPLTLTPHSVSMMARSDRTLSWRLISEQEAEERYLNGNAELSPLNGFFSGATITSPNLLLAMWAGAKTIYLIGCDHFYAKEDHKDGTKKTAHEDKQNHFHPEYRKPGEIVNAAPVEWMNRGYALVRRISDRCGVRIVNISRRSALDAFERGSVEQALDELKSLDSN